MVLAGIVIWMVTNSQLVKLPALEELSYVLTMSAFVITSVLTVTLLRWMFENHLARETDAGEAAKIIVYCMIIPIIPAALGLFLFLVSDKIVENSFILLIAGIGFVINLATFSKLTRRLAEIEAGGSAPAAKKPKAKPKKKAAKRKKK